LFLTHFLVFSMVLDYLSDSHDVESIPWLLFQDRLSSKPIIFTITAGRSLSASPDKLTVQGRGQTQPACGFFTSEEAAKWERLFFLDSHFKGFVADC
jgi:hypothetical protein